MSELFFLNLGLSLNLPVMLADFFSILLVDQRRDLDRFLNQAIARKRL